MTNDVCFRMTLRWLMGTEFFALVNITLIWKYFWLRRSMSSELHSLIRLIKRNEALLVDGSCLKIPSFCESSSKCEHWAAASKFWFWQMKYRFNQTICKLQLIKMTLKPSYKPMVFLGIWCWSEIYEQSKDLLSPILELLSIVH